MILKDQKLLEEKDVICYMGRKRTTDLPKMRNTFCRLARRLIKEDRVEGG